MLCSHLPVVNDATSLASHPLISNRWMLHGELLEVAGAFWGHCSVETPGGVVDDRLFHLISHSNGCAYQPL